MLASNGTVLSLTGSPHRSALVTWLLVASVATIDVSVLNIFRYLLLSDVLLLAAALLACIERRSTTVYSPKLIQALFVLYLLSTAFAFLQPVHPAPGVLTWIHSAFLMLIYIPAVTTLMVIRADLRAMVLPTLLVSTTVQAAITVQEVARGLNWQTGTRIPGAFGSIHVWSYAASVVGIAALVMTRSWRVKTAAGGSFLVIVAAEMFRKSRMLWIASLLGAALFAVVQARHKATVLVLAALIGVALTAGYMLDLYHPAVQERIDATLRPTETPDLVARIRIVEDVAEAFTASPIVGLGLGQSPQYLSETPAPPPVVEVHNVVMHAAVEGGAVAGLAVALLPLGIVLLWTSAQKAQTDAGARVLVHWLGASLIAIYVAAQLTPALFEHTFYLLIAVLASFAWPARLGDPFSQSINA